ncbi:MAG: ADP-heptose--LPS heptosyltransferase [Rhodospirillaceae bacterium]|nr:MAG: ADP-heptose--LPS heptosyltransferase [Rhodospirillaceae bacterium]
MGPFAAIRRHHKDQPITLLTTKPFEDIARASGLFDDVWTDGRPGGSDLSGWLRLRRWLLGGGFGRVYDLQTSDRSSFYFRMFWPGPKPEWSGIARGCSHPHANPDRDTMHTVERQAEQLEMAGISDVAPSDLSWAKADVSRFGLNGRYVLLAPGGAQHRQAKRWPADCFAEVAVALVERDIAPVLLGSAAESDLMAGIKAKCSEAVDLSGQTSLLDLVELGRDAVAAIGNDTGPMHLIAAVGCKSVVLFSEDSDPALCAQRGPAVTILRRQPLSGLSSQDVLEELD